MLYKQKKTAYSVQDHRGEMLSGKKQRIFDKQNVSEKKERERNSIMTCKMVMCINQRMTFIRFFEIAQNPSQIRRLF